MSLVNDVGLKSVILQMINRTQKRTSVGTGPGENETMGDQNSLTKPDRSVIIKS